MIDDTPVVCATHLRFLPCRAAGVCRWSSQRNDIAATYLYQQGGHPAANWLERNAQDLDWPC